MQKLLLLSALFLGSLLSAQKATMKKWMLPADKPELLRSAAGSFEFEASMQISFNSYDLYDTRQGKGEKPARMESIKELEKELKGTAADAEIFAAISEIYKRLNMPEEAETNRQKAIYLFEKTVKEHPDSVNTAYLLATMYVSNGRFNESIQVLKQSLEAKPDHNESALLIAMIHLFSGQYDSIYPFIKDRIEKYPDVHSSYMALSIHYFYNMYRGVSQLQPEERILTLNTDSVMEMDLLYNYWQRNKTDFQREYLYRVCYQTTLNAYLLFKSLKRPEFDTKKLVFSIDGADKDKMLESEKFFKACLKNNGVPDKYLTHKILGNLYLVMDEPAKAIPHFKKAIDLRPVSKSTLNNNADAEYENLIACHFILKDTAACEKILLEKIKIQPAIDPNALDYEHLGNLYLAKKRYAQAEKMYQNAIGINYANSHALMGLAFLKWMGDDRKAANDYISKAYAADKENPQVYCLSGMMALEENDAKNAYEFFLIARKYSSEKWIDETFIKPYFEVKE